MDCCQGIETCFDTAKAEDELQNYRRHGPAKATRWLIDALKAQGIAGATLLDIGGGVGAIQHELLRVGAASAVDVDASRAYLGAARQEAARQGHADRVTYRYGDFVQLADTIAPADIVTLDRVICCYPDMPALVSASAARARRLYGLVFPRDVWWMRVLIRPVMDATTQLRGSPLRFFVHSARAVDALVRASGLTLVFQRHSLFWSVAVYAR